MAYTQADENLRRKERIRRWDDIRRAQLSFSINLFLTFAVGAIGFLAVLLSGNKFPTYGAMQKGFFIHAFIFAGASSLSGIIASVLRLCDFRLTAKIIRKNCGPQKPISRAWLEYARARARALGDRTWVMFWLQCGTFILAMMLLAIAVISVALTSVPLC